MFGLLKFVNLCYLWTIALLPGVPASLLLQLTSSWKCLISAVKLRSMNAEIHTQVSVYVRWCSVQTGTAKLVAGYLTVVSCFV